MTLKRAGIVAVAGLGIAVGVAQAGWFFQSGRWYYTPDIGSEFTITRLPNNKDAQAIWTLETGTYGFACINPAGNEASETVMVRKVMFSGVDNIPRDEIKKQKGKAFVDTHIDTSSLGLDEDCVNPNWHAQNCGPEDVAAERCTEVDPKGDTVLVYEFTGTFAAKTCSSETSCVTLAQETYHCALPPGTSPLNLPDTPEEKEYTCTPVTP
jgi:hypothetical protein